MLERIALLEKQPYHKLLKTLEELMGKNEYLKWLAEKFPNLSENPIAIQNRAMQAEAELKEVVIEKIINLRINETLRLDALERAEIVATAIKNAEKMQDFIRINSELLSQEEKRLEKLRMEQEIMKQIKAQLFERIPSVENKLEIVRTAIQDLQASASILVKQIDDGLVKRTKNMAELIDLIPESNNQLIEVRNNLRINSEKVNNKTITVEQGNNEFNKQMNIIKDFYPNVFNSIEKNANIINYIDKEIISNIEYLSETENIIFELQV